MPGFPQPDDSPSSGSVPSEAAAAVRAPSGLPTDANLSRGLEEPELDAALQLLVERAQYITGATGTALALPQAGEMVCRASAGSCAPSIGARLQVRSGLTGESITRRQLLRCDNAEADPRVNLEACRALGIASIVVLPLLRQSGEVRGLFELFSDHAYAFEERDLIALERMADLTLTALDLAEQRHGTVPPHELAKQPQVKRAERNAASLTTTAVTAAAAPQPVPNVLAASLPSVTAEAKDVGASAEPSQFHTWQLPAESLPPPTFETNPGAEGAESGSLPDSMLRVQKCASCGFPVSEGRALCLDCETKKDDKIRRAQDRSEPVIPPLAESAGPVTEEPLPPFLANTAPVKESWLSDHVNLLVVIVLILGVLVAIVLFR
ncbi:MAG: GAF domain-containing protein [Terriglobales bacterium]